MDFVDGIYYLYVPMDVYANANVNPLDGVEGWMQYFHLSVCMHLGIEYVLIPSSPPLSFLFFLSILFTVRPREGMY